MYTQLLESALDQVQQTEVQLSAGDAIAELLRSRGTLRRSRSSDDGSGWALGAVADQLAYDIALISLARCLAIECDLGAFGRTQDERSRLEQALAARGIHLDDLDDQAELESP
jgi:hypothetical protein